MSTQKIKVFVRCRPLNEKENGFAIDVSPEKNEVSVLDRHNCSINGHDTKNFSFDHVFAPQAKQVDVYKTVVRPLIDQVLLGFNCTVFAYGQTGTGKTYTMEGYRSDSNLSWDEDPHCGIIPRAVSELFNLLRDEDNKFCVKCSFLELYNEDAYDLLSSIEDSTKLRIYDDANRKGSVIVGGLTELVVKSKEDIFDILERGSAKRQTAATLLNACSSRSHTIFTITVQIRDGSMQGEDLIKIGKLNLVDLAGSENIGRSGAQDIRAREAGSINQALLTLGRVITALVEKRPHIPYRESKLTRLLQDSLGGRTKTSLIATVSPSPLDYEDTVNVLEYACRAKNITNNPEVNTTTRNRNGESEIVKLRKEIETLQDRHQSELGEIEYKVRNEVAVEFRREIERIKQSYKETYESCLKDIIIQRDEIQKDRDQLIDEHEGIKKELGEAKKEQDQLREERDVLKREQDDLKKEQDDLKKEHDQLRKERDDLKTERDDLRTERDQLRKERDDLKTERDDLRTERDQLKKERDDLGTERDQIKKVRDDLKKEMHCRLQELDAKFRVQLESKPAETKKATKIRSKLPEESIDEYANLTFDEDELAVPSAKKGAKPNGRKRNINPQPITMSGKKKKLISYDEIIEISPVARVTRSRATRAVRKLEF